jgi:hypothetical protein
MKADRRKEIEAKLLKLISESEKNREPVPQTQNAASYAKVIRRRKGNPDLHIA